MLHFKYLYIERKKKEIQQQLCRRGKRERSLRSGEAHRSFVATKPSFAATNCFTRSSLQRTTTSSERFESWART